MNAVMHRFLPILFLALVAPQIAYAQAAPIPAGTGDRVATELAQGVYTFGNFSRRSIFVVGDDGVIATDPVDANFAKDMRVAIAKVTPLPVKYVIYSHQHWDHVRGGKIFKDEGAVFVSHRLCMKHFKDKPDPDVVMPDQVMRGGEKVSVKGKTMRLLYFGRNHGDCMLVMQPEGSDVLFVSDLLTPYSLGLGFMPDYDPVEWLRTLSQIEARTDWQKVVGGHGVPFGGRDAVTLRRTFLEQLMVSVKAQMDQGRTLDEIISGTDLPDFKDVRGYKEQIGRAAERIYHYYEMGW
jgi:glyoxylase-like metal-dependent hydrolase (beta-lactamase superfamily II)